MEDRPAIPLPLADLDSTIQVLRTRGHFTHEAWEECLAALQALRSEDEPNTTSDRVRLQDNGAFFTTRALVYQYDRPRTEFNILLYIPLQQKAARDGYIAGLVLHLKPFAQKHRQHVSGMAMAKIPGIPLGRNVLLGTIFVKETLRTITSPYPKPSCSLANSASVACWVQPAS
ncbi:hypothetical protein FPCIR_8050 [Fusarium pseudocircinatum]|uniref:Uncharacterized protein n=1 Tax=Fusarium pseudocircinatum TaxID=56676 RepID=A0A8H5P4G3_9HYPO|nr:hypothetical protein FPCIR_8050 [Fusarium pseudocircinatum]